MQPPKGWFCEGFPEMIGEFFGDLVVLQIGGPMDRLFPGYFGDGKTVIWRGFCQLSPGTPTSLNTFSSTACQSPKAIRNPTSRCVSDLELFCRCAFLDSRRSILQIQPTVENTAKPYDWRIRAQPRQNLWMLDSTFLTVFCWMSLLQRRRFPGVGYFPMNPVPFSMI